MYFLAGLNSISEKHWDIKEVKHMKKKKIFQNNLVMIFFILLIGYFIANYSIYRPLNLSL